MKRAMVTFRLTVQLQAKNNDDFDIALQQLSEWLQYNADLGVVGLKPRMGDPEIEYDHPPDEFAPEETVRMNTIPLVEQPKRRRRK